MNMKTKNVLSAFTTLVFAFLFFASVSQKPVQRIVNHQVVYEKPVRSTDPTPCETSYELPVLVAVEQTKQNQTKGGVTVSCEITPFEVVKLIDEEKELVTADPDKPGYDIYKVASKPRFKVQSAYDKSEHIWFNIRIKNNQDRILKLKDVAIIMLIDGVAFNIPEEAREEWIGGMLVKGFEKTQMIRGPKISGLITDKIVYFSINDVPTMYTPAGEVAKKENFEWYYQVTKQKITKQESIEYTFQESPVYKEICTRCSGDGKVFQEIQCDKCLGTKQLKYTDYQTGKSWIGKCDKCSGTGTINIPVKCSTCVGAGNIAYPKSPKPKVSKKVDWTGWEVAIITQPSGLPVYIIDPSNGEYTYVGVSDGRINWFSSNTESSESYPIVLEYQGKKYKILPYDSKGNPSPTINAKFLKDGGVELKGGKIAN
ncbi:MAG: hypothetical protein R3D58_14895 [Saprospiraceae bacterium]